MKYLLLAFAVTLSFPALAQTYTDGRGNAVAVDPRTEQAINDAKALRGKYYNDRYNNSGNDGVTIMRDGAVYHFNRDGVVTRGDLDYRRDAPDALQAACGGLRPTQQKRCIRDYNEQQQKLMRKYRN